MQKQNLKVWGIVLAAFIVAAWLSLTHWQYGARTWGFRLTHQVVAVNEVRKDGQYMPYVYRDVYFITQSGNATVDVQACAAAFGHDMNSETHFTRCHAFLTVHSAQMQADNVATCELARSEQTPYMDAKKVQVALQRVATCDIG